MSRKPLFALILLNLLLAASTGCGTAFTGFTVPNGDVFARAAGPATAAQPPGGSTPFPVITYLPGFLPNPQPPAAVIPVIIVH